MTHNPSPAPEAVRAACHTKRASTYARVVQRPERQTGLRARTAWLGRRFAGCGWRHVPLQRLWARLDARHARLVPGARVVMLDDGSTHEVVKNHPDAAFAARLLGVRARKLPFIPFTHHWVMVYESVHESA